jgi:transcriptional regulator with GAF, ATPase, and Fis domain
MNIVRSELFGHVEGAFTGAIRDKTGLVEIANGGLLILEEVGELPFEAQAMLLTFIETGEYRRFGDEKTRKSEVRIVAATNRESDLRADFRYRFFPYYIPPIQARRGDILYYFNEIFPELTKSFTRSEVLLLLSHNWPGSVREIERIGRLLIRNRSIVGQASNDGQGSTDYDSNVKISHLDPRDTSFDPGMLDKLCREFKGWDVDLVLVERLLGKHRVSLDENDHRPAFPELEQADDYSTWFDEFALKFCDDYQPFQEAYEGYQRFCDLFLQDPAKEANVLATLPDCLSPFGVPIRWEYPKSYEGQIDKLSIAIMKYLKRIRKSDKQLPRSPYKAWIALEEIEDAVDRGADSSVLSKEALDEISKLKEDKLLRQYYDKLLKTSGGNVRAAAKKTGLEENTFRSRLTKLGLKRMKKN